MKTVSIIIIILSILVTSCAMRHSFMKGTVAKRIDDKSGIACLETESLKIGDTFPLLNNDCSQRIFPDSRVGCQLVNVGEVEVTKILNKHYAEFKKISGTNFTEGSILGFHK